jgi:hypothetical protein
MLGAKPVVQILIARALFGLFQITFASADPDPVLVMPASDCCCRDDRP